MLPPYSSDPRQTLAWRLAALAIGLLAVGWLLGRLSGALAPFVAGALLAYACDPLADRLEARGLKRPLAAALVMLCCLLAFVAFLLSVVPLFVELSGRVATRLPGLLARIQNELLPWLKTRFGLTVQFDLPHLAEYAQSHAAELQSLVGRLLSSLSDGGKTLLGLLTLIILVPVVHYYLLVDWDRLLARLDELIPRRWHAETHRLLGEIDAMLAQFLRGQLLVMLLLAAYYALALAIAGVDFALPLGLLTGLLIFIPYVGFTLGLVFSLFSAALQGGDLSPVIAVATIYGGGQILESFVLTPWLVGERIGLHPVAVIFALLAFGQLFGFVGLLIALPAAACLLVGLRALRASYLRSALYRSS